MKNLQPSTTLSLPPLFKSESTESLNPPAKTMAGGCKHSLSALSRMAMSCGHSGLRLGVEVGVKMLWELVVVLVLVKVEARKLEHHSPPALKVKYRGSQH